MVGGRPSAWPPGGEKYLLRLGAVGGGDPAIHGRAARNRFLVWSGCRGRRASSVRLRPPHDPRNPFSAVGQLSRGSEGGIWHGVGRGEKGSPGGRTVPSDWAQGRDLLRDSRDSFWDCWWQSRGWGEATQVSPGFPEGSEASLVHAGVPGRVALGAPAGGS